MSENLNNYKMFIQDNAGQWYKILVSDRNKFDEWIEFYDKLSCQFDEGDYDGPNFDKFRCMHPCNYMASDIQVLKENNVLSK